MLSIVIPCYNEQDNLPTLYERLTPIASSYTQGYEIILVNDGSRDATWESIVKLAQQDPHVVGLNLSRNYGHQIALTAGLEHTRGERILILDADLQDPPELLPDMMRRMDEGYDVVYGKRESRKGETWFKRVTAAVYYRLLSAMSDITIPADTGDFRLMNRKALDALNRMPESSRYIRGMVSWVGFKQTALPYTREPRQAGKTHYTFQKMLNLALDGITGFSIRPLRIAFYFGLAMTGISLLLLLYVLGSWLFYNTIRGWTSLLAIILVFQGIQWIFLGLIGEYLGRVYIEAKQRPKYFVSDSVGRRD